MPSLRQVEKKMQVDIIGGGLSGLSTALSIKDHDSNVKVCVHEKHDRIGFNRDARKCGEAHCIESFSLKWKPPDQAIASPIYHGETIAGKKKITYERKPDTAWILDRPAYIAYLGEKCTQCGVEFSLTDKITDVWDLSGDIIVDASGCPSVVKKQLGFKHRFVGIGYQQTIEQCSAFEKNTLRLFFDKHGGYYWLFPRDQQNRELNIGIGVFNNIDSKLPPLLEQFKKDHQITGLVNYTAGGLIPGGIQYPLRFKNIIFVGDAGVGTLPINGQGIYRALMSGDIAGEYIVRNDLKGYVHQIIQDFIKMDLIGKTFLGLNTFLRQVNTDLVVSSWNWYQFLNKKASFFKSEFDTIQM